MSLSDVIRLAGQGVPGLDAVVKTGELDSTSYFLTLIWR